VYFVVKERSDSSCSKSKSLGRKIHPLAKRTRLEVHVAISAITEGSCGAPEITDHRECHAGIPRQVLSKTECCGNKTLITNLNQLQFLVFRPVAINSRSQAINAMDVEIQLNL